MRTAVLALRIVTSLCTLRCNLAQLLLKRGIDRPPIVSAASAEFHLWWQPTSSFEMGPLGFEPSQILHKVWLRACRCQGSSPELLCPYPIHLDNIRDRLLLLK
jgi:hypothetical protein